MWDKVQETVSYLQGKGFATPDFGIILGSGLGKLIDITIYMIYQLIYARNLVQATGFEPVTR